MGKIREHGTVKNLLDISKPTLIGNEVRKFSESELHEIISKALSSKGALFELNFTLTVEKHPKEGLILRHYIFVPLSRELEFI
ncbi:hypothetical protein TERMP_01865 [Thermococcus barophilus MP]|uniref:Uncharacterized protein n=2 Tax=Thermococcus barophilus TaxID=55802 RepID=F0LKK6_THEBM|nr:hypothetical protein TERMP_01865 [Thermococcus barophilus MP]